MRFVTATILTLAMAGCADMAPRSSLARQQLHEAEELQARYASDLAAPSFAVLAGKIDLNQTYRRDTDPCAAVREDRVPTAEESVALRKWSEVREVYLARIEAVVMTEPAGTSHVKELASRFDAVMDNALRGQSVLISNLVDGHLTYCQFAQFDKAWTEDALKQSGALRHDLREVLGWEYFTSHRFPY